VNGERPNGVITWQNLAFACGGMVGFVGLGLTLLGFVYAIYGREQDRIQSTMQAIQDREVMRVESNAYHRGQTDQKISDARETMAQWEVSMQREMRLLDDAMMASTAEADRRFQGELGTIATTLNARVSALLDRIEQIDNRQRSLIEFMAELRAGFDHQNKGP
jgi:DNA anti-recombination protein RmuC